MPRTDQIQPELAAAAKCADRMNLQLHCARTGQPETYFGGPARLTEAFATSKVDAFLLWLETTSNIS
jgi:hypothetical protein